MPRFLCYAVRVGRQRGLYTQWRDAEAQVKGHAGAVYKGFADTATAERWLAGLSAAPTPAPILAPLPVVPPAQRLKPTPHRARSPPPPDRLAPAGPETGDLLAELRPGALVVYCDGACRANGKVGARAGIGVWFGPGDARNVSAPVARDEKQTNQVPF